MTSLLNWRTTDSNASQTLPETQEDRMLPKPFIKAIITMVGKTKEVSHAMEIINQYAQVCNYSVKS